MAIIQDIIDSIKGSASETTTTVTPTASLETVIQEATPVDGPVSNNPGDQPLVGK